MVLWYTARGAGLSALVLLSVATALGAYVTLRGDVPSPAGPCCSTCTALRAGWVSAYSSCTC